jgi:amphi-Trp domain-containing protein
MGKKKKTLFKSKELRKTTDVAEFLRQLADRLEDNQVVLRQGEKTTEIEVPDNLVFKIKVKKKVKKRKTKHTFKINLKWKDGAQAKPVKVE